MGCDIHTALQVRDNDAWYTVDTPVDLLDGSFPIWEDRNYTLFRVLAGVHVPSIVAPRGLPDDIHENEVDGHWLGEHSQSWLTIAELAAYDWSQPCPGPWAGTLGKVCGVERWLPWMKTLAPDLTDVRLVFGFDS